MPFFSVKLAKNIGKLVTSLRFVEGTYSGQTRLESTFFGDFSESKDLLMTGQQQTAGSLLVVLLNI
jgi:hypothetical protein